MIRTVFFTNLPTVQAQLITCHAPAHFQVETHATDLPDAEKIAIVKKADMLVLFPGSLSASVLKTAPQLKLIQLVSAGYEHMDLELCARLGIAVANNGGTNAIDVAEHTLALALGLYRRLVDLDRSARAGNWDEVAIGLETRTIYGKKLGIVGLGHIGQRVGRLFSALGADLLYSDAVAAPADVERELSIRRLGLDELMAEADIISLHVPLLPATRGLIGSAELAKMKEDAILINTCRGAVIDEEALYQTLSQQRIAGAALDVFAQEPTPLDYPLMQLPNLLATPHAAGVTRDTWARRGRFVFENLQRAWDGEAPLAQIS
ncbi:MAG: 2-hydroxyacid dehydrogenase [Candidatus Latescibacterota bacterium]|jgi:phosphoglycerate dehydrogenase-like enzyme